MRNDFPDWFQTSSRLVAGWKSYFCPIFLLKVAAPEFYYLLGWTWWRVCVCVHVCLRVACSSTHMALVSGRWEACGKRQLQQVKTFFMDDFLWHSWRTGWKSEWEANYLKASEGGSEGGSEGARFPQGGVAWGRQGGKKADKMKRLGCLFREIKSKNRCLWSVLWSGLGGGGCRKIRGMRELGETRGEKRIKERTKNPGERDFL